MSSRRGTTTQSSLPPPTLVGFYYTVDQRAAM